MTSPWDAHLQPVLRAAHARLSRAPEARSFSVELATVAEREALADLLGSGTRPGPRATVRIDGPAGLAKAVEEAAGRSLVVELEERFGPLVDPSQGRREAERAREETWAWWCAHPIVERRPALAAWGRAMRDAGARGGPSTLRDQLEAVLRVLAELPAGDELLPVLAGRLLNDTHALDAGSRLSSLVLGAVAAEQGVERPTSAAERRALWRAVGVRDDELSSVVLVAGLRPWGDSTAARLCRAAAAAAEVAALTLAQVRRSDAVWRRDVVHVVENPAILALAVDHFGADVPPLVCSPGWPTSAVTTLLADLAASGALLRHHGDLDGEGLRIAAHLSDLVGAEPWRMTADDYLAHVAPSGAPVGRVTEVPWDARLAPVMRERGIAVLEETVWSELRGDLEQTVSRRQAPISDAGPPPRTAPTSPPTGPGPADPSAAPAASTPAPASPAGRA